jgi:ketol-acid reductoisomerase
MKQILTEIQSGEFAKPLIAENEAGLPDVQGDARPRADAPARCGWAPSCAA